MALEVTTSLARDLYKEHDAMPQAQWVEMDPVLARGPYRKINDFVHCDKWQVD